MTAIKKYQRLEALGRWRPNPQEDQREVVVSIGNKTLVIRSTNDQAITHWSLAAIERFGPSNTPAVFHPNGDPSETLELSEDDQDMVMAIETLRKAVLKSRPRPVRWRWLGSAIFMTALVSGLVFWMPDAVQQHTLKVVPDVTRVKIGEALLTRIERITGPACRAQPATPALKTLALRTDTKEVIVLRSGPNDSFYLPGGKVLVNRNLIEDFDNADVVAGFILAARLGHHSQNSLATLLDHVGLRATLTLLTTGFLPAAALDEYAQNILHHSRPSVDDAALLAAFQKTEIRSAAYAKFIERPDLGKSNASAPSDAPHVLRSADWQRLKAICTD